MTEALARLRHDLQPRRSRAQRQALLYVISALGGGLLAVAAQALLARALDVDGFATYAFCFALLQFASILFEFGLFAPAARRAAIAELDDRREIVGAALVAYLPVGAAFSILIFALSFVVNAFVSVDAKPVLMLVAPVAFVFPFTMVVQLLAQGTNRLHVFSISNLFWQALFVVVLAALGLAEIHYDSGEALLVRALTLAVGLLAVGRWLRPRFASVRRRVGHLIADLREYGFAIYVGRVMSTGTYNMDVLLVAAFADAEEVAFYALARALAYGVGLPATGASSAVFTKMAALPALPDRWIWAAGAVEAAGVLVLAAIAAPLVDAVYGPEYAGAVGLVALLAVSEALRGISTFYNGFLNAHGRGAPIRRAGVVFSVVNIVASLVLIPPFGAAGAAWASLFGMTANLVAHVHGYRRSLDAPRVAG